MVCLPSSLVRVAPSSSTMVTVRPSGITRDSVTLPDTVISSAPPLICSCRVCSVVGASLAAVRAAGAVELSAEGVSAEDSVPSSSGVEVSGAELSSSGVSGAGLSEGEASGVSEGSGSVEGSGLLVTSGVGSLTGTVVSSAKTVVPKENSRSTDKSTASVFEAFFIFVSTSVPFLLYSSATKNAGEKTQFACGCIFR